MEENEVSILFRFLLDKIEKLEWLNNALTDQMAKSKEKTASPNDLDAEIEETEPKPRLQVLHQVICSNTKHQHDRALYLDQPKFIERKTRDRQLRALQGNDSVLDLEAYLKENPDISFVVLKSHVCEVSSHISRLSGANKRDLPCSCRNCVNRILLDGLSNFEPQQEQLRIVSQSLKTSLKRLGRSRTDGLVVGSEGDPYMYAPYLYLYHHRQEMVDVLKTGNDEESEHLQLLKDFIDLNYGEEYKEADNLFKSGMVSEKHLPKLFKPNQVVVSIEDGEPVAHVLHCWPFWHNGNLHMRSWSWEFNGHNLQRVASQNQLKYETDDNVPVTKLPFFPIDFASKETIQTVVNRGQKFWTMREGYFASYSGWDSHRDQFYVSFTTTQIDQFD